MAREKEKSVECLVTLRCAVIQKREKREKDKVDSSTKPSISISIWFPLTAEGYFHWTRKKVNWFDDHPQTKINKRERDGRVFSFSSVYLCQYSSKYTTDVENNWRILFSLPRENLFDDQVFECVLKVGISSWLVYERENPSGNDFKQERGGGVVLLSGS